MIKVVPLWRENTHSNVISMGAFKSKKRRIIIRSRNLLNTEKLYQEEVKAAY